MSTRQVFSNLVQPLSEERLRPDENIIKLSEIDPRLPNVEILSDRYFVGRPTGAVAFTAVNKTPNENLVWVCPCRIAGIVYVRPESKCGYCGKARRSTYRTTDWDFPPRTRSTWMLERLDPSEVQPYSEKHKLSLPRKATGRGGYLLIEKSGILFVILRAMGYGHQISYCTAAQAIGWKGEEAKVQQVIGLLISSGELADLKAELKELYAAVSEDSEGDVEDSEDGLFRELVDAHLDDLIHNATEVAARHKERTSTREYQEAFITLGIHDLLRAPPRAVQKGLTDIVRAPKRSREEIALAGRLLDELNQEIEDINFPRHRLLKDLARVRDELHGASDSTKEIRRKAVGEVEGFSL